MAQRSNLALSKPEFKRSLPRLAAHSISARSEPTPTKAVYICAGQPVTSLFACDKAAGHTFGIARHSGAIVRYESGTLSSVMPDMMEKRRNWAVWLGFLLALGAMLCNVLLFANPPGQRAIPWLSVLLAVVALILLARGLQRAFFGQPRVYRGKILSSILFLVSLLLAGVAIFTFFHARALPPSAGAPQVGQKAPDFTLADTTGQPVSLDHLFAPAADDRQGMPPRAVLLIFYRGYW
jgi:hypothetical protein